MFPLPNLKFGVQKLISRHSVIVEEMQKLVQEYFPCPSSLQNSHLPLVFPKTSDQVTCTQLLEFLTWMALGLMFLSVS